MDDLEQRPGEGAEAWLVRLEQIESGNLSAWERFARSRRLEEARSLLRVRVLLPRETDGPARLEQCKRLFLSLSEPEKTAFILWYAGGCRGDETR